MSTSDHVLYLQHMGPPVSSPGLSQVLQNGALWRPKHMSYLLDELLPGT